MTHGKSGFTITEYRKLARLETVWKGVTSSVIHTSRNEFTILTNSGPNCGKLGHILVKNQRCLTTNLYSIENTPYSYITHYYMNACFPYLSLVNVSGT